MTQDKKPDPEIIVIKKYANRRLYNTDTSSYVTLEHLAQMVKDDRQFVVKDAKSGEDITRAVLAQIIFDEESKRGQTLLPAGFLRQLISFYGHGLESVVPTYLENALEMFSRNQEHFYDYLEQQMNAAQAFAPGSALGPFEEIARQNMAAFDRAARMFAGLGPDTHTDDAAASDKGSDKGHAPQEAADVASASLDALQRQLQEMQDQLNRLSGGAERKASSAKSGPSKPRGKSGQE